MKRIFAVIVCVVMMFAFSACGNAEKTENNLFESAEVTQNNSGEKMFSSMEEYVNAEGMQNAIADMKKSLSGMYDFNCIAEGDSLVYEYRYKETVGEDALAEVKSAFDNKFEEMKPTVKSLMKQIVENVDVQEPRVVLRFCNSDGSVIAEKIFDKTILN
ncbi:DUF4854 domain-containing protein [Ruminococcus sp.]|uniref:DUF4854 domain-containing protein n=1 Tax=Ruminococcus sp. TaxID=41978 RepID=UPI003865AC79